MELSQENSYQWLHLSERGRVYFQAYSIYDYTEEKSPQILRNKMQTMLSIRSETMKIHLTVKRLQC